MKNTNQQGGSVESARQKIARAILGKNFFGVKEWLYLYGINFSIKQLCEIDKFPWSEDVLNSPCPFHKGKSVKETHFAFLGLDTFNGKPLTILKLQELHPATGQPKFYSYAPDAWYAKEKFGNEQTCGFRWYLMPLEIIPKSENKTFQEQAAMLPINDYEVPHAIEEITKVILYYRNNGIYLNPESYGRCQDVASGGVGRFGSEGLGVSSWSDDRHRCDIGLAASRKFPALQQR